MDRKTYVAGRFYPDDPTELRDMINGYLGESDKQVSIPGVVLPHAGYIYSGKTAGAVVGKIKIPDTVVIFGPNHTGLGKPVAVYPDGNWKTPLGSVEVDMQLSREIVSGSEYAEFDTSAHETEHSIEVILPFLQVKNPKVKFVPIAMGTNDTEVIKELAESIDKVTKGMDVLFIASSDFTHYEPEYTAKARDKTAIEAIKEMDWEKFIQVTIDQEMSICGVAPICLVIELSKRRGAEAGKLLAYTNSGVMSHDFSNVVTYAGIAFK